MDYVSPVHRSRVHDHKNVGRFYISGSLLHDQRNGYKYPNLVQRIYSQVIPVQINYDVSTDIFSVTSISKHFREITEGDFIPEYEVIIERIGPVDHISFKEKYEYTTR